MTVTVRLGIAQILLGLRLILKLFGASSNAPFVRWTYETSDPLLYPFEGIFPTRVVDGSFIIEFSTLFAILIYSLIGYVLVALITRIK